MVDRAAGLRAAEAFLPLAAWIKKKDGATISLQV